MRIAYISGSYLPSRQANSIHVMRMTDAMASLGHDVTLYARRGHVDGQAWDDEHVRQFYGVSNSTKLMVLPATRTARGREFWYALQLRKLITKQQPDLIYGRHTLGLVACQKIARTAYEIHSVRSGLTELLERRLIRSRRLAGVVSITQKLCEDFRHQHSFADPIHVEPDAVTPVDYDAVTAIALPGSGKMKVGYCGHLYPGRGGEFLIKLARLLPDIAFHLVGGESKDIERCKGLAKQLANVHFHGFVPPQTVPRYLKAFDVLAAPYQETVQAFGKENIAKWISPMKLFEYMDAEKPIVVSDLPVLREVIEDGVHARMVPTDSLEVWKQTLLDLRDPGRRRQLGEAARKLVRERYTWKARAERVLHSLSANRDRATP